MTTSRPSDERHAPLIFTEDIFTLIDDGHAPTDEYVETEALVCEHGRLHPGGLGGIVVIPAGVKPPPDSHRRAVNAALAGIAPHVRGLAWVVEAQGFEGAAVRGILIGLALLARRSYPTRVTTSLEEALRWLAPKVGASPTSAYVERVAESITHARATHAQVARFRLART
jgi:hypothetical protein